MILRKVVFPAAGLGTRFLPVTKCIPKEMLPIVDKPLIQYGVEEAMSAGFKDVIVVTGRGKNAIEDYFDHSFELEQILSERQDDGNLEEITRLPKEINVAYIRQKKPLGLGHAVLCTEAMIAKEEYFAVVLSDDIIDAKVPVLKQMVNVAKKYKAPVIALMEVERSQISKYGIIKGKQIENRVFELNDMIEKPAVENAPSNLAIIGRYILPHEIFSHIKKVKPGKNGEIQLTDALRSYGQKKKILGYVFEGTRYDAGDKFGYLHANLMFGLKRKDIGDKLKHIIKT